MAMRAKASNARPNRATARTAYRWIESAPTFGLICNAGRHNVRGLAVVDAVATAMPSDGREKLTGDNNELGRRSYNHPLCGSLI